MSDKELDPNDIDALRQRLAELESAAKTSVRGQGAIAQNDSIALGNGAIHIGGSARTVVTGGQLFQLVQHYQGAASLSQGTVEIGRIVIEYLRWLRERTGHIELRGIERSGGARVVVLPLRTAYVPLRVAHPIPLEGDVSPPRTERDLMLDTLLDADPRLVITGTAGSGKTTVLLHIASTLADRLLADSAASDAPRSLPLPIFVSLASFARHRRAVPANAQPIERTLSHFVSNHLVSRQAGFDLPADFFIRLLQSGQRVILLLDGLDEVADAAERAEVRQAIEDLAAGREQLRIIVTCRTVTYRQSRTALGSLFRELAVTALTAEQIARIIRQAYECIYPHDAVRSSERSNNLIECIERLESARQQRRGVDSEALVASPLFVRLLLIVHFNERRLPVDRAELFERSVNALLQVDYGTNESDISELSRGWQTYREIAQHLAFHLHCRGPEQGYELDEHSLRQLLSGEDELGGALASFIDCSRQRGGLVAEHDGTYRFIHLAFQEFLVARYLREIVGANAQGAMLQAIIQKVIDPWWREPILLLMNYLALNAAKPARDFIARLSTAGSNTGERFAAAELAAQAALEWNDSGDKLQQQCVERIAQLLSNAGPTHVSDPSTRARAGELLSRRGDRRFRAEFHGLPADERLGFVRIAADPNFRRGTRSDGVAALERVTRIHLPADEINDDLTPTVEFMMARFPVTVGQFRAFAAATGWTSVHPNALRDSDSRPVRWITYANCIAYCEWLNEMLQAESHPAASELARLIRNEGWRIGVPSELEWEKAARGPLGSTSSLEHMALGCANSRASRIGDTSVVGCFPPNGYGLFDMIGNVWEWTSTKFTAESRHPSQSFWLSNDSDVVHVVKGGSWSDYAVITRPEFRGHRNVKYCSGNLGFRLVLKSGTAAGLSS